jgi:hypothetical protein
MSTVHGLALSPRSRRSLLALLCLALALGSDPAAGDAIVRTQAMFASTIAEYYVDEGRIRLELEIGLGDLEGFRNLVPDELYEKLGHAPRPLAERQLDFFTHDLVVRADAGDPLLGRIEEIGSRERIVRDAISGEPLPPQGEGAEVVVYVRIVYPLEGRPSTLTFQGPALQPAPSVGYVAYHRGIAVNDFRYLTPVQTLELDWGDPWYSAFQRKALRRTYFAPVSGFIYVEPYEVRKEIVARPLDLQRWVDLGLEGRATIPVEIQADVLRRAAAFLRERQKVVIDGREIAPELARINFLERTLRTSRVIDPPRELDVYSAILGAIFVYPTDGLPDRVSMDWELFDERIQRVPGASVDQAGPLPVFLEPDFAVLEWQNFLKNPVLPTLVEIRGAPTALERLLGWLRWVVVAASIGLVVWLLAAARRGDLRRATAGSAAVAVVALGLGAIWVGSAAVLSNERGGEVVGGLLHNIYRAFDYRDEERIYDTLERSVSGDLLERIYLETRKGLELASQGGARAKVKDVELVEISTRAGEGGAFVARATWNVHGSVGHWGHVHKRSNRYQAELEIAPEAGRWKLVGLEFLDEQRL